MLRYLFFAITALVACADPTSTSSSTSSSSTSSSSTSTPSSTSTSNPTSTNSAPHEPTTVELASPSISTSPVRDPIRELANAFPADVAPVFTNCADPRVVLVVVPISTLTATARRVERTLSAWPALAIVPSPERRGQLSLEVAQYMSKFFKVEPDMVDPNRGAVAARCADAETCRAVAGAMRASDPKFAPAWFCGVPPATTGQWHPPPAPKVTSPR